MKSQFNDQSRFHESLFNNKETESTFSELDFKITEKEVNQAVRKLKNKKSAGLDNISNDMLKSGKQILTSCLPVLKIFNMILRSGCYPSVWKIGYIKPLHKNDDPCNPANYRGISIMPCLSRF